MIKPYYINILYVRIYLMNIRTISVEVYKNGD